MDLEADAVAEAMREPVAVTRGGDQAARRLVYRGDVHAGPRGLDPGPLCDRHQLGDLPLPPGGLNPPAGTKSYALLRFDPEGRPPGGVSHWVAYGIPVSVTGFAEGEVSQQTEKYVGGKSLMGLPHYFGPCTPPGAPHHYTFTLIATDLEPSALQPGMTRDELIKALDGHAKGATGIIGTFSKP